MSKGKSIPKSEKQKIISEFETSGKSKLAWCKENKISPSTFNGWYKKFKNEANSQNKSISWVTIQPEQVAEKLEASVINIKLGKAVIEINSEFNSNQLLKIVKVLNSIC